MCLTKSWEDQEKHASWSKLPLVHWLLDYFDFVCMIDADLFFYNKNVPLHHHVKSHDIAIQKTIYNNGAPVLQSSCVLFTKKSRALVGEVAKKVRHAGPRLMFPGLKYEDWGEQTYLQREIESSKLNVNYYTLTCLSTDGGSCDMRYPAWHAAGSNHKNNMDQHLERIKRLQAWPSYERSIELNELKMPLQADVIPRLIWQTTHLAKTVVPDLLGKHAVGYERKIYDDAASESFIASHFPRALQAFRALKGAHRADLWRYCVLYIHGGVYLDIKTVLHRPLDQLFPSRTDKCTWYAVICASKCCMYNGIIATPPRNPIFLTLIEYIVAHSPPSHYHAFVNHMKDTVDKVYGVTVHDKGVFENSKSRVVVRQEVCDDTECLRTPSKRKDRYGLCCNIYDLSIDPALPVITVRDPDYPWKNRTTTPVVEGAWHHE